MSTQVQRRRGTTAQHSGFTGAVGEITVDTDKEVAVVHDGATAGGFPSAGTLFANTFVPTQTLQATENFFGNTTDPDNAIVFQNPVGVGTNTLDFRTNTTLDANFIRKYNTTPFNIETASSGNLDFVMDSRNVATGTSARFWTNGIRDSGTQTLLFTIQDNGGLVATGALNMGTNLINNVVNPVAAQDAATKSYVDGLIAAGAPPFTDSTALVKGSGDPTKLMRFEVDGFTAAATRVLTPPDADITLAGINIAQTFALLQTFSSGITLADASLITWLTRSVISSPSNGVLRLTNNAQTDFTRLQFGGTTSAFPAIGRNLNVLEILGADGAGESGLLIYGTKTSATNFERLNLVWSGASAQIFTEKGSTGGIARALVLGTDGQGRIRIETTGEIEWGPAGTGILHTDGSISIDTNLFEADVTTGIVDIATVFSANRGTSSIGFFGAAPVVQQNVIQLTNNVTAGGTADQLDDFNPDPNEASTGTDLVDISTVPDRNEVTLAFRVIQDDLYQLGEKVNQIIVLLEQYGLSIP